MFDMGLLNTLVDSAKEICALTPEELDKEIEQTRIEMDLEIELHGKANLSLVMYAHMLIEKKHL